MSWKKILAVLVLLPVLGEAAEWKMYGGTNSGTAYYDRQSVKIISRDVRRVLTKNVVEADNHLKELIESLKKRSIPSEGYGINAASKQLLEINCSSNRLRMLNFSIANSEGAVLFSEFYNDKAEWIYMVPESTGDKLSKIICPPKKK